jgi:hypothetical protein
MAPRSTRSVLAWGFSFSRQGLQGIEDIDFVAQGAEPEDQILVVVPGGLQTNKNLLGSGLRHCLGHLLQEKLDPVKGRRYLKGRDQDIPKEVDDTHEMVVRGYINRDSPTVRPTDRRPGPHADTGAALYRCLSRWTCSPPLQRLFNDYKIALGMLSSYTSFYPSPQWRSVYEKRSPKSLFNIPERQ